MVYPETDPHLFLLGGREFGAHCRGLLDQRSIRSCLDGGGGTGIYRRRKAAAPPRGSGCSEVGNCTFGFCRRKGEWPFKARPRGRLWVREDGSLKTAPA